MNDMSYAPLLYQAPAGKARTRVSLGEEQRRQSCWRWGSLSQHMQSGGVCEWGFLQTTGRNVLLTSPDPYGAFQLSGHLLEGQHSTEKAIQELLTLH